MSEEEDFLVCHECRSIALVLCCGVVQRTGSSPPAGENKEEEEEDDSNLKIKKEARVVNQTFRDYKKVKTTSLPPLFGDVSALESCLCYIYLFCLLLLLPPDPYCPFLSFYVFPTIVNDR